MMAARIINEKIKNMSHCVTVQFSFRCYSMARLVEVAKQTLNELSADNSSYTKLMFEQVIENPEKYLHDGNAGDMFVWGGGWNNYSVDKEIPYLRRFLANCWRIAQDDEQVCSRFAQALLIIGDQDALQSEIYQFVFESKSVLTTKQAFSDLQWHLQ